LLKVNTIAALATAVILSAPVGAAESAGNLNVTVRGANNNNGVIRIAVYNNKDAYAADKDNTANGSFRQEAVALKDKSAAYTFKDVPYGEYAIKLFHDEDNSGKFYTGMFGMPKVQYGFSNNAKGMMGPASYAKASFSLKSAETNMTIDLSK
jgi:uncharacterized protein (DUF2141 family)